MKFLMVAPRYINQMGEYYEFPLGMAYVSASLKKAGFNVVCINTNHYDKDLLKLLKPHLTKGEAVLCTGGLSVHFHQVQAILQVAKEIKKELITVVGGGLISSEPELMLQALDCTYGVLGEGEETIVELAKALQNQTNPTKIRNIKGLVFFNAKQQPEKSPPRPPIKDIDTIPFPDYEGFEVDKYIKSQRSNDHYYTYASDQPRVLPMIASRSCLSALQNGIRQATP